MKDYQKRLAELLAKSGALMFRQGLRLKDGRPTPYFVNLGVFRTGRLSWALGRCFADWFVDHNLGGKVDVLLGPSYKGSAIAQAMAIALQREHGIDLAFDYDRKEAKTHGEHAGKGSMFVTGALQPGTRVLIIDDVGTSMATKVELLEKIQDFFGNKAPHVVGVALAVDRQQTQAVYNDKGKVVEGKRGADALAAFEEKTGLPVWSLLGIREAVDHLVENGVEVMVDGEMRELEQEVVDTLEQYLAVYGREEK